MQYLFKAFTNDASSFKTLIELIHINLNESCITLDKTGISMTNSNTESKVMLNFFLNADGFEEYIFNYKEKEEIGINFKYFYKLLKSIKKKDSLEIFITKENPTKLGIKTISKAQSKKTVSYINTANLRSVMVTDYPDIDKIYKKFIIIPSNSYSDMCRILSAMETTVVISASETQINFKCQTGEFIERIITFGENFDVEEDVIFEEKFLTETLTRIQKISGLNPELKVYIQKDYPLLFQTSVGTLGTISIYAYANSTD